MNETMKQLSDIFCDVFDDNSLVITENTIIKEIRGYDSLVHISLIASIQEEFKIRYDINEIMALNSVSDIISSIENKK